MASDILSFEEPAEKPIRRSELGSPTSPASSSGSSSRSPSPSALLYLQSKLAGHFQDSVFSTLESSSLSRPPQDAQHEGIKENSDDPETVPFRLFTNQSQRIRLRSPTPGPGAFVQPRPLSHYFALSPSSTARARLAASAVSHEVLQAMARTKWSGYAMPWRVTTVILGKKRARRLAKMAPIVPARDQHALSSLQRRNAEPLQMQDRSSAAIERTQREVPKGRATGKNKNKTKTKTKPNKKRRLVLRERQRAVAAAEAAVAAAARKRAEEAEEAEARDRLKRAARNRAKRARKVKKKKANATREDGAADGAADVAASDAD